MKKRPTPTTARYKPRSQHRSGFAKPTYEELLSREVSLACIEYLRKKGIVTKPWNGGPARGSTEGDEDEP